MRINRSIRLLLLAFLLLAIPVASSAGVFVSINIAPPALPVYVQPPCPADGYIWTPGYWAYGDDGYYWVPGTWVEAPEVGFLWTPGYWGWGEGAYLWHAGYWGPHIGFYGGVNYGFGYGGEGYEGGHWEGGHFAYNRSVTNVNVTVIHNVYNKTVIVHNNTRVSFNGGHGGIDRRPSANEERFANERHIERTSMQTEQEHAAAGNRELRASVNHGKPAIAATERPGQFSGHGVVAAKKAGAPYKPAPGANRAAASSRTNNVPRPGNKTENNAARPESKVRTTPAAHNNVARPPNTSNRASTPRAANAARPEHAAPERNVPRPSNTSHQPTMSHENAPHPQAAPRMEHTATPRASTPHTEKAPSAPHQERAPRPESHPQAAPHQASTPHPQSASRPEKPEEKKH